MSIEEWAVDRPERLLDQVNGRARAAPVRRRLLAVVIGRQKRTPSEALTVTVVIKPIKGPGLAARPAVRRSTRRRAPPRKPEP